MSGEDRIVALEKRLAALEALHGSQAAHATSSPHIHDTPAWVRLARAEPGNVEGVVVELAERLEELEELARIAGFAPAKPSAATREAAIAAAADELADDLLTAGSGVDGTRGDRLVIMLEGRELAGWSREALTARLRLALRRRS